MNDDQAFKNAQRRYDNMEPPPDPDPSPLCDNCQKRPPEPDYDYCNECAQEVLKRVLVVVNNSNKVMEKNLQVLEKYNRRTASLLRLLRWCATLAVVFWVIFLLSLRK